MPRIVFAAVSRNIVCQVDTSLLSSNSFRKTDAIFLQVEASTRTHINETRHAHLDQLHDSAVTLNQVTY